MALFKISQQFTGSNVRENLISCLKLSEEDPKSLGKLYKMRNFLLMNHYLLFKLFGQSLLSGRACYMP